MRELYRLNGQAGFALLLVVFGTVYASQIPKLGLPFADGREPGASFMPILLATILVVGALRVLVAELRGTGAEPDAPRDTSPTVPRISVVGPVVLIALTALFAFGLPRVGYFVAAAGYTFGVAFFFDYEQTGRPVRAAAQAAVTAAAISGFGWLFFEMLFELSLPGWTL